MIKTQTAPKPFRYWHPRRDKYGRSAHHLVLGGTTLGVVVKMPRTFTSQYPQQQYLANNWTLTDRDAAVSYWPTLKAAKAHIEAMTA